MQTTERPTTRRPDITPRPAEFNAPPAPPPDPAVGIADTSVVLTALLTIALAVLVVGDPWTRLGAASTVTGFLAAFVVLRTRRRLRTEVRR